MQHSCNSVHDYNFHSSIIFKRGQSIGTLMTVFWFLLVICPPPNPPTRNYSHWTRNHALYWIRLFHFYHPYGYIVAAGRALSSVPMFVLNLNHTMACSLFALFFTLGVEFCAPACEPVAYVKYALNRCAIADQFPPSFSNKLFSL